MAKLQSHHQEEMQKSPLVIRDDKLQKFEDKREQIQQQMDKEVFRAEHR